MGGREGWGGREGGREILRKIEKGRDALALALNHSPMFLKSTEFGPI